MATSLERLQAQLGDDLERLLARCGDGDSRAWDRLLAAVREMAIDLARRSYHMGLEDAEDLAQLTQLRVLERLPQLRRPKAFPLWVRRVVHHVALDMLRQRRPLLSLEALSTTEDSFSADLQEELAGETRSADPYDQVLLRADLDRALSHLPDRYREPIRLHLLQGMPQDQVGQRLGRPRSTVATQIDRGLNRLRRSLSSFATAGC